MTRQLFANIVARMPHVACPFCLNTRFSVVLRCDFSTGNGCALVGECRHCGAKFDIENIPNVEEMQDRVEQILSHLHCACGRPLELEFLCDLATENCYFAAVCRCCGSHWQVFPRLENPASLVALKKMSN